uniref:Uncharacterized protein n=1 Tax=Arundo donax TaxID=35708 RepID=A0A0A9C5J3_ARUDO
MDKSSHSDLSVIWISRWYNYAFKIPIHHFAQFLHNMHRNA